MDIAPGMLRYAYAKYPEMPLCWVCADAERLPLQAQSVDLIVSNFALQWCEELMPLFTDVRRSVAPGGKLLFTLPGEGTLSELEASWQYADPSHRHVNRFPDINVLAEMAETTGWRVQQLAVHTFQTHYPRLQDLLAELKTLGAHNVNRDRAHQLTGKQRVRDLLAAYECYRRSDGLLPATWQVIVGEWIA
jgi:malonyl-CoA O-methyltransferase